MEKIEFENKLLEAIKKDDLKSFSLLMPTNADLNLCYGRFPILSLLYLYSSYKILSKFESRLMPIHNFKVVEERNELYKTFKTRAKKSIRFFSDGEIIYPVLMLAVLNERTILKQNFKFLYKNAEINDKLLKIYKIRHYSDIFILEDSVKIPTMKITRKQTLLFSLISFICCLFIVISSIAIVLVKNTTGFGTDKAPIKVSTKQEFLSALKYGSRTYSIQKDIELDGSEFVNENFSGTIFGNGHTVMVEGEITAPLIKDLLGKVENLNFKLNNIDARITQNFGILAENSSGIIEKCSISGNFVGHYNSTEEIFAGMFVSKNTGDIVDSNVQISATLSNSNQSNAYFGGFAGVNNGRIFNCFSNPGIVNADTVDLAGIVCQNYGEIFKVENKTTLLQTSDKEWHPNIAGVSIANYGTISDCKNYAELKAVSQTNDETGNKYYIFVGGIACENYKQIVGARNFGKIIAKGEIANIVAGGLVAQNIDNDEGLKGVVDKSLSKSDIDAKSESGCVCVGGVVGLNSTTITNSGFIGKIDADTNAVNDNDVFVSTLDKEIVVISGGVVGVSQYSEIKSCYADVSYTVNNQPIIPAEENAPQKLYNGIVGNVGIYAYIDMLYGGPYKTDGMSKMDKNYYVEKAEIAEFAYGVYATTSTGYYISGTLVAINDSVITAYFGENSTAFNKCASLAEIPLEVVYE